MPELNHKNDDAIVVRGARVHNLKNISITIPRDRLTVITGPSGSGKSSLAFDTIYAEGQRRYVESLSAYARQFLQQFSKPEVDTLDGLSPTISIEQKTTSFNPRSTVGTVTETYDYLRLLFARIGKPFCWSCGTPIHSQSQEQIIDTILSFPTESRLSILAPIIRSRKGEHQRELQLLRQRGFVRVRIDGEVLDLSSEIVLDKNKKHDIDVSIDRLLIKEEHGNLHARISDSVALALRLGNGQLLLQIQQPQILASSEENTQELLLSERFACAVCNIHYPTPEPRTFSFNSALGACPKCDGLGLEELPEQEIPSDDLVELIERRPCQECKGARLRKESLHYKINEKTISEFSRLTIPELLSFLETASLTTRETQISERILAELRCRLECLIQVGVDYLSLDRSAQTLSGGEAQRIRLATQIGSSLVGVIYVIDEPSIGLHQRDHAKLLKTLLQLRDRGNTVLVVEHDRQTIEQADWIVDLGPGAGIHGGSLVAYGTPDQIRANKKSLTGLYLKKTLKIPVPSQRRPWTKSRTIQLEGANQNNLKNISVDFPLGVFTCVTGVSGSGKSTLVLDTLYRLLLRELYRVEVGNLSIASYRGLDQIDKVIDIDQKPIGKTHRSNPATYTGLFTLIRDLYAELPESHVRGYTPGVYSFNVKGGRCESCEGAGLTKVEMHFLPAVYVPCEKCLGRRYNLEILELHYKGKSIADVLEMTAEEALAFFDAIPSLKTKLKTLNDVGLGYLTLGQNATTLSGGEAQRVKLSRELSRRGTGRTLYILDEPSTGLHFDDIKRLLQLLHSLVDLGNTVVVIEHNLDIIKTADYVIDLGPEGGNRGGMVIAAGTPDEVAKIPSSFTGQFLSAS